MDDAHHGYLVQSLRNQITV